VLAVWLAAFAAALPLALRQSDRLTAGGYEVAGSEAKAVEELVSEGVPPDFRPTGLAAVLAAPPGADPRPALRALSRAAAATPGVELDPLARDFALAALRRERRHPAVVPLTVSASEFESAEVGGELRERLGLDEGRRYGEVRLYLVGAGALWAAMLEQTEGDLRQAERLAFPVVLVILLVVFGSVAAAALPLLLGAASVAMAGAGVYLVSAIAQVSAFAPSVASMLGLAVAVDYALFVVLRYREELRRGASPAEARRTAMATSGTAVMWSGLAVIIALASLFLVETPAVRSLAAAAILVVAVALAACATLLPALLALLGRRVGEGPRPRLAFARLAHVVQRRPGRALALSLLVLAVLAAPALDLDTGDGALRQLPAASEARRGFEQAVEVTGPGRGAPLKLLVAPRDVDRTVAMLRRDPEVVRTGVRTTTSDGTRTLVVATPRRDGEAAETRQLVRRVRAQLPAGALVGGATAMQVDFADEVEGAMGLIVAWVVVLSGLMLLLALRSVPLALGAVLATLLSVATAFGVLTAVYSWGWLDGLLGLDAPGYVDTIAVPVVFAAVFGLSMDYQVFLLRRIRERRLGGADTREAVLAGVVSSARTITSAAIVMIAVFVAFIATGLPAVQQIGLGAAVAIAVDATVVRLLLLPAAMTLAGERCWWMPGRRASGARARIVR
jgi:uncharacterized membrane protein YdfJ with MMPL/SSD domain